MGEEKGYVGRREIREEMGGEGDGRWVGKMDGEGANWREITGRGQGRWEETEMGDNGEMGNG